MRRIAMVMVLLGMVGACEANLSDQPDGSANADVMECPKSHDPVPCIRRGQALAGAADQILVALNSGDSTTMDSAAAELDRRINLYEVCADGLLDLIFAD